jgi:trigger factor
MQGADYTLPMTTDNVKITRDDAAWEVEVQAHISAERMKWYREETLKELQRTAKLDGFRPGHAPIERILATYGEQTILQRAAERAIQNELPEILAKENILVIEAPRVQTEAPQEGTPLAFTARAPLAPEVTLPDWKTIGKRHPPVGAAATEVSDDEHKEALTHLTRERARIEKIQAGEEARAAAEAARSIAEGELPPLDDAFAQSLGYESAEVFTAAVRTNMRSEKEARAREARRNAILEDLVKGSSIRYPAVLREYELDDMETRITDDLARMGSNFEQYLAQVKKTREELRKEWSDAADKRAKIRLLLSEIARQANITPEEAQIKHELEHAQKMYPNANPENLRAGITHALRNEKVMELLESQ